MEFNSKVKILLDKLGPKDYSVRGMPNPYNNRQPATPGPGTQYSTNYLTPAQKEKEAQKQVRETVKILLNTYDYIAQFGQEFVEIISSEISSVPLLSNVQPGKYRFSL